MVAIKKPKLFIKDPAKKNVLRAPSLGIKKKKSEEALPEDKQPSKAEDLTKDPTTRRRPNLAQTLKGMKKS